MKIYINGKKYILKNDFNTLSDIFNFLNISFPHPCGGKKKCGKCKIKIKNPMPPQNEELSFLTEEEINSGMRLSCLTSPFDGMDISFENENSAQFVINSSVSDTENSYIAIDIGTTNIEAELFNKNGERIAYLIQKNSQITAGADVISRIEYDIKNPGILTDLIINQLDFIIAKLKSISPDTKDIVITGNTVMLYILTGKNTLPLAKAPYKNIELFGKYYNLPLKNHTESVYIPKCIDAFVGADITCGIISSENTDSPSLFVDLGTNGEIVLYKDGKYYNSSTAAGPCFEGASLNCGSPAIDGAVSKVWFDGRNIKYKSIGNTQNNSICASGVIDFLTVLLRTGQIFKDGKISKNSVYADKDKIYLSDTDIYLSQQDIRNIQLAKSAVYTGITCLLKESNTDINSLEKLYLFGNFSKYLNIKNAFYIGLLPEIKNPDKIHLLGNGALNGAKKILFDKISNNITNEEKISQNSINIDLNSLSYFQKDFIKNINF